MKNRGAEICPVTLRIGIDTFLPLRVERVEDHAMHSETYVISEESAVKIQTARKEGRRIIAVGTTAVRVLESAVKENNIIKPGEGKTDLYIYPGYTFKAVDALLTNFHLPRSSLVLLVSAFMGNELREKRV